MTKDIVKNEELNKLQEVFGEDLDLFLFYVSWIKNGLQSGKAYRELHPEVTEHSAETLGSRMLSKVERPLIMQAYGLDLQVYYKQLKDGLGAMQRDQFTGELSEDHKTRKVYHDKLGKQLGIETNDPTSLTQINIDKGNEIVFVDFKNKE